jgi:hypothetical protein
MKIEKQLLLWASKGVGLKWPSCLGHPDLILWHGLETKVELLLLWGPKSGGKHFLNLRRKLAF